MSDEAPWTIGRLLTWTTDYLRQQDAESPRLDAEVLLAHSRGCPRIALYTAFDETPVAEVRDRFRALVRMRGEGTPVAYLVGMREFYSLEFEVTPDVLIPRPETELIVVALTDRVKARDPSEERLKIADVGAGSGVLAICAAKYVENADVLATDFSEKAIEVATRNAQRHGVDDRVYFVQCDLFPSDRPDMRLDFVVSNPPYITTEELDRLDSEVRDHEPRLALEGGLEGTSVIERLIPESARRLKPGGTLLMEISPTIVERVEALVDQTSSLERRPTIRDLEGRPRVVEAVRRPDA